MYSLENWPENVQTKRFWYHNRINNDEFNKNSQNNEQSNMEIARAIHTTI